ncbi:hypothetical protein DJ94_4635 [Bacillus pseudomycoides]|nr:hypothetical protein DJ94_4635 [Bacillus pseudomycoides]
MIFYIILSFIIEEKKGTLKTVFDYLPIDNQYACDAKRWFLLYHLLCFLLRLLPPGLHSQKEILLHLVVVKYYIL